MRKFLIKEFAGYNISKLFGKVIITPRASKHIASAMMFVWMCDLLDYSVFSETLAYLYLLLSIFVGFIYFLIKPIDVEKEFEMIPAMLIYHTYCNKPYLIPDYQKSKHFYDTVTLIEKLLKERRFFNTRNLLIPFILLAINLVLILCQ